MHGEEAVVKRFWFVASIIIAFFLIPIIPVIPSAAIENHQSSINKAPPLPYGPNVPIGYYNGTGDSTNALATYNKTEGTKTQTNDTDDFTILVITNWEVFSNISFEDITAKTSLVLDIETNDTVIDSYILFTDAPFMGFRVSNSCKIHSLQSYIWRLAVDVDVDASVRIYNATNAVGTPKPDQPITSAFDVELGSMGASWINYTFSTPELLNTTNTYDNHFFIKWQDQNTGQSLWGYRNDTLSPPDSGPVWYKSPREEFDNIDLLLNVTLLSLGLNPAPSQVSMQVNRTSVVDATANTGWWTNNFKANSSSVLLDISSTWPITFNYTYHLTFSNIFSATTYFNVTEGNTAAWNITVAISFPSIGANPNSRSLNFTIPAYWTVTGAYNESTPATYSKKDGTASDGWVFIDEPGGAGNGTNWRITATDFNYVKNVHIYRGIQPVNKLEINITDSIEVDTALESYYTDGTGRLTLYDALGTDLTEWAQGPSIDYWLNFSTFTPDTYTSQNGMFTCEVVWGNGWHVGVNSSYVWLVHTTEAIPTQVPIHYVGSTVRLKVYYNDSFNDAPIIGADVNVTIDGTTYDMLDWSNGTYTYDWDTTSASAIDYDAQFVANATGYSKAIATTIVPLYSRTQLDISWHSNTINYTQSIEIQANYTYVTGGTGGIIGATVEITIASSIYPMKDLNNGNYSILLNGTDFGLGVYGFSIDAQNSRCEQQQEIGDLTVQEEPTTLTGNIPPSEISGTAFNASLTYELLSGGGIDGASFSCLLNGTPFTAFTPYSLGSGEYRLEFILNVTGISTFYNITITVFRTNYSSQVHQDSIFVTTRSTILTVLGHSASPLVYDTEFVIWINYTDSLDQGVLGAQIVGNWSMMSITDQGDGTYTIRCNTTNAVAGQWTVRLSISSLHYEIQWFTEAFDLLWPTVLSPLDGLYDRFEYENETFIVDVYYEDTHNEGGVGAGTLWVIFQSVSYDLSSQGSGVYRLTLNLTGVLPSNYTLDVFANGMNYEAQQIQINLEVKAKISCQLSINHSIELEEGREIPVSIQLTFLNGTPIEDATLQVLVWVHHVNGTDVELISLSLTTDQQGSRIVAVLLPWYGASYWENWDVKPIVWVSVYYGGCREIAAVMAQTSGEIIQRPVLNPFVYFIVFVLLPIIVVIVIITVFAWIGYIKRVKPKRLQRLEAIEASGGAWAQRIMGLVDARALFVMHSKNNLPIFTYSFTGEELSSELLSGFISAVIAFRGELGGDTDREAQLQDIDYKDLHLSLREGEHALSVLIIDASPTEELTDSLAEFTAQFEEVYGLDLVTFDGRVDVFDGATEIVEKSFHTELLLAHECTKPPRRGFTRKIYNLAIELANAEFCIYLPQLFVYAVERFGAEKKFAIADAIVKLRLDGCLAPHPAQDSLAVPETDSALTNAG